MKYYAYYITRIQSSYPEKVFCEISEFCKSQDIQLEKNIFTDLQIGKKYERKRYEVLTEDILCEGDALIIPELDILGRNKKEILGELIKLNDRGVRVMVITIPTTLMKFSDVEVEVAERMKMAINSMLVEMYSCLVKDSLGKKEKQPCDMANEKKVGECSENYGRPRAMLLDEFGEQYQAVLSGEKRPFELKNELGLTTATFYRYKKEWENRQK